MFQDLLSCFLTNDLMKIRYHGRKRVGPQYRPKNIVAGRRSVHPGSQCLINGIFQSSLTRMNKLYAGTE